MLNAWAVRSATSSSKRSDGIQCCEKEVPSPYADHDY